MDDIMRQNPDLMSQFTKAAMGSMEQNTHGLSNFMNGFGGQGGGATPIPSGKGPRVTSVPTSSPREMRDEKYVSPDGLDTRTIVALLKLLKRARSNFLFFFP
jgi:hypothetical protein